MIGELRVQRILKRLANKLGGYELRDAMFGEGDESSQIDNVLISSKAIYVIEVKYYKGWIFGNDKNKQWKQTIKYFNRRTNSRGKTYYKTHIAKTSFYNPVSQNKTHIKRLKSNIEITAMPPVYNIVVFSNAAELRDVVVEQTDAYVINMYQLKEVISTLESGIDEIINVEVLVEILDQMLFKNITNKIAKKEHVRRIASKYN